MQVVNSLEDLLDRLRRILLRELPLVANPVKQLASRSQLRDNVVLILWQKSDITRTHV
jgi:hypothetical protein